MQRRTLLATVSAIALVAVGYGYYERNRTSGPTTLQPTGESDDHGLIVRTKTIDYQAIIKEAVATKAAFLTLTLSDDLIRHQHLSKSIEFTPFPASTAEVRVKYHVEFPIGYLLSPGKFSVSGGKEGLVITLHRPRLIARPSVRLLSYDVVESGILIDEKTALLELQQRIQPESEKLAKAALLRPDILPVSENALRGFLQPFLKQQGQPPPPIKFEYR